jgi:hypothetical protein
MSNDAMTHECSKSEEPFRNWVIGSIVWKLVIGHWSFLALSSFSPSPHSRVTVLAAYVYF